MIKTLIELLQMDDYYGVDPLIDFAKGSHKAPLTIKEGLKLSKRVYYGKEG